MTGRKQNGSKSMKRAFFSVAVAKYTALIVGIAFSAVMARLLKPDDYGVFAVANLFVTFFYMASDLGIGAAIIQRLDLTEDDISHIYTFTGGLGALFGLAMSAIGIPLFLFYGNRAYLVLCPLISVAVFFCALNIVPNAVLLRNGMYGQIAARNFVVSSVSFLATLAMAYAGCRYYSLAGQAIVTYAVYYAWNQHTVKLRIVCDMGKIRESARKIASYSMFQFAGDLAYYIELNMDNYTIGIVLGSTQLAYYDKAYRLLDYPVGNLAGTLNTVLHPMLKDYQDEPEVMKEKFLYIEKVFSLVSILLVAVSCICSREIVGILYGQQWEKSVLTFRVMALAIYPKMLLSTLNTVFMSLGDTRLLFRTQMKRLAITAACIFIAVPFKRIEAVAAAIVVSGWVNLILAFSSLMRQGFHSSGKVFARRFGGDIAVMFLITAAGYMLMGHMHGPSLWADAVRKGVVLLGAYTVYLVASRNLAVLMALLPAGIRNRFSKIGGGECKGRKLGK